LEEALARWHAFTCEALLSNIKHVYSNTDLIFGLGQYSDGQAVESGTPGYAHVLQSGLNSRILIKSDLSLKTDTLNATMAGTQPPEDDKLFNNDGEYYMEAYQVLFLLLPLFRLRSPSFPLPLALAGCIETGSGTTSTAAAP
jgi:hypothetical protein